MALNSKLFMYMLNENFINSYKNHTQNFMQDYFHLNENINQYLNSYSPVLRIILEMILIYDIYTSSALVYNLNTTNI